MNDQNPAADASAGSVIHATREAIVAVDEAQRVVLFNPAAERMFGCGAAEIIGMPLGHLLPERYRRGHAEHVRAFAESGRAEQAMDERQPVCGLRSDGTEFPIAATISRAVVSTSAGPRRALLAMMRDLSDEVALHADLARANSSVRALIELAPVATWIVDDRQVVFANRACARLFGVAEGALGGRPIAALFDACSLAQIGNAIDAVIAEPGQVLQVEARIVRSDGARREVEVAVSGLPGHGTASLQMALVDVTERCAEAQALERSRRELRELAARAVQAREDERRRISRELHDDLGQRLTAIKMAVTARTAVPVPAGTPAPHELAAMVDEAVAAVRRIASDLRPAMLDDLGLFAAIDWIGRNATRHLGIEVDVHLPPDDVPLPPDATIALYRIAQESLTNAARHAGATRVELRAQVDHGELVLTVRDNGTGFPAPGAPARPSFGLLGMRERALMVGGRVELDNPPGGGARVTARVPLGGAGFVPGS